MIMGTSIYFSHARLVLVVHSSQQLKTWYFLLWGGEKSAATDDDNYYVIHPAIMVRSKDTYVYILYLRYVHISYSRTKVLCTYVPRKQYSIVTLPSYLHSFASTNNFGTND